MYRNNTGGLLKSGRYQDLLDSKFPARLGEILTKMHPLSLFDAFDISQYFDTGS